MAIGAGANYRWGVLGASCACSWRAEGCQVSTSLLALSCLIVLVWQKQMSLETGVNTVAAVLRYWNEREEPHGGSRQGPLGRGALSPLDPKRSFFRGSLPFHGNISRILPSSVFFPGF